MDDSPRHCGHCGAALGERATNFCEHCGAALAPRAAAPPPLPGAAPPIASGAHPPPHAPGSPPALPRVPIPPPAAAPPPRGAYVREPELPPAPHLDAPETGQFSDSPGAALKAFLVSGAVLLIPCCGIGIVLLILFLWFFSARAAPRF